MKNWKSIYLPLFSSNQNLSNNTQRHHPSLLPPWPLWFSEASHREAGGQLTLGPVNMGILSLRLIPLPTNIFRS